jgi:hypothetical protein
MANAPLPGRDGDGYSADFGFGKTEIFLWMGLDTVEQEIATDLPVGRKSHAVAAGFSGVSFRVKSQIESTQDVRSRLILPPPFPPFAFGRTADYAAMSTIGW